MKLEQRRMFEVDGYDEPCEVDVIYKNGKPFISSIAGNDEFYQLGDSDVLFETKEEADKYYSTIIAKFDSEEIKKYIEELGCYSDKLKRVLPDSIYSAFEKGLYSHMCLSFSDIEVLKMALNGILNVNCISFRASDISIIKYGSDWLSLVLNNREEIVPQKDIEVFILKSIFGENKSGRYYSNIKKPSDL